MRSHRPIPPSFLSIVVLAVTALLAGCGGSSSPSPSNAAPSALPPVGLPSGLHADAHLEGDLPDAIAGETLTKLSFKGNELEASGQGVTDVQGALSTLGKSLDDVTFAIAGGSKVQVGAYRIDGVDGEALLTIITNSMTQGGSKPVSVVDKGGKSVKVVSGTDTAYFYARGDIVFFVAGGDDAAITEALSKLP